MLKDSNEISLETLLVTVLNVVAVYLAAFTYRLNWSGVLTVMIVASLFTATITHLVLSKLMAVKVRAQTLISETVGVLGVALISSLAVLLILTMRFNLPQALGIALLSGVLTSLLRFLLSMSA